MRRTKKNHRHRPLYPSNCCHRGRTNIWSGCYKPACPQPFRSRWNCSGPVSPPTDIESKSERVEERAAHEAQPCCLFHGLPMEWAGQRVKLAEKPPHQCQKIPPKRISEESSARSRNSIATPNARPRRVHPPPWKRRFIGSKIVKS